MLIETEPEAVACKVLRILLSFHSDGVPIGAPSKTEVLN